MKVYIKSKKINTNAVAEYDIKTKKCIVCKGSVVSEKISDSETFRAKNTIKEYRDKFVENGIVKNDVVFKSASTAANFVTGSSTNGLVTWKDKNGRNIKKLLEDRIDE